MGSGVTSGHANADFRTAVLSSFGAEPELFEELLTYTESTFRDPASARDADGDEPHLPAWSEYAREASERGAWPALQKRFVQLRFPVEEGISQTEVYRKATRQGIAPGTTSGLVLEDPQGVDLTISETIAGRVPVITSRSRADFETLVRAFSARNEPVPVPPSMGACIVTGFNNWDRLFAYRDRWQAEHPEESWSDEFRRIIPRKDLYEDRFVILSSGPYSGVPAAAAGYDEQSWRGLSIDIRREHECTHYFTYRVLGSMRNNLQDELIADYAGLVRALGGYRSDLALLFFGLEGFPRYRAGGRLENYRGKPPLSDRAFEVLQRMVHAAVGNMERMAGPDLRRTVLTFCAATLEELASGNVRTGGT
jgi:hypothetical protein